MKKRTLLIVLLCGLIWANIFEKNVFAYNNHGYPHTIYSGCMTTCYQDDWDFCKNNCTSYVAYMLKDIYGIYNFSNSYKNVAWRWGGNWDNAAKSVNIVVDNHPLPGDVVYWDKLGDAKCGNPAVNDCGHVAWVEKVHFDSNGNAVYVDITEYNYISCSFSYRTIAASEPDGYIHILAYNEGVTGLFYVDCYEMSSLCDFQTSQEWTWIIQRVANYRCTNCGGGDQLSYANSFFDGLGLGGGGSSSLPDFVVNSIWLENDSNNEETVFTPGEYIQMKAQFKNKGDDSTHDIEVKFYLSNGAHVDDDKQHVGTDNIRDYNMESGETHTETEDMYAPMVPGIYNIIACADTNDDVEEEHESNNCSDEAVFQVVAASDYDWLVPIINFILQN